MGRLALDGVRILDLTTGWSGPFATKILADNGAEVIHLESPRLYDFTRGEMHPTPGRGFARTWPDGEPGERPWERSAFFNEMNRNKISFAVDLTTPEGRKLVSELALKCDVVMENFRPGVVKRWGLDHSSLRARKPELVYVSGYAFGIGGPEDHYTGYGLATESLSGLTEITGYDDTTPYKAGVNYTDPTSGIYASMLILAGLEHRRRTGTGLYINLSQREALIGQLGEAVMEFAMNKRNPRRHGNRDPSCAPQGCYPCAGEDRWITISVRDDAQWLTLCQEMGRADLAEDPRFQSSLDRWHNHDEADRLISEWTRGLEHYELMHRLQKVGVPAAAVLDGREGYNDPHLRQRGFFERVFKEWCGEFDYPGMVFRLSKTPGSIRKAAPSVGDGNDRVLREILGLSEVEVRSLESKDIVGDYPLPGADGR